MTTLTPSQRVFNFVFPPGESPFLSGYVRTEKLRPDQQRLWDIVTRILHPKFSQPSVERGDVTAGISRRRRVVTCRMEIERRQTGLGRTRSFITEES
jgi:hypothetical protein